MSTCLISIKDTLTPNSKHAGFKVLCLGRTLHTQVGRGGRGGIKKLIEPFQFKQLNPLFPSYLEADIVLKLISTSNRNPLIFSYQLILIYNKKSIPFSKVHEHLITLWSVASSLEVYLLFFHWILWLLTCSSLAYPSLLPFSWNHASSVNEKAN